MTWCHGGTLKRPTDLWCRWIWSVGEFCCRQLGSATHQPTSSVLTSKLLLRLLLLLRLQLPIAIAHPLPLLTPVLLHTTCLFRSSMLFQEVIASLERALGDSSPDEVSAVNVVSTQVRPVLNSPGCLNCASLPQFPFKQDVCFLPPHPPSRSSCGWISSQVRLDTWRCRTEGQLARRHHPPPNPPAVNQHDFSDDLCNLSRWVSAEQVQVGVR